MFVLVLTFFVGGLALVALGVECDHEGMFALGAGMIGSVLGYVIRDKQDSYGS